MKQTILTLCLILFALPIWGQTTFSGGNISGGKITSKEDGSNKSPIPEKKKDIEWVEGLYAKSLNNVFSISSKDYSKFTETGETQIIPIGTGDFSGDGIPEFVYAIQYWDLKKGSKIKPIFLTSIPGEGFSLFKPIMDIVPYTGAPRSSIIKDLNGDGVNDIFIADHGVDHEPYPGNQNTLILSAPNGKFIDATPSLPKIVDFTHGVTSGDIDKDGDLDLFVTQAGAQFHVPHYFLRNDGEGKFTKVPDGKILDRSFSYISKASNHKRRNFYFTPGLEFIDNDDKLDLILLSGKMEGNENNKIVFGSNSGFKKKDALELENGRFGNKSLGYNYLLTDIDNDGDKDLIILHSTKNRSATGTDLQVLIQEKNRQFIDKSNFYFPHITFDYGTWGMSLNLVDINNDDMKDLIITSYFGIEDRVQQKVGDQIKESIPKVFIRQVDGSFRALKNFLLTGGKNFTVCGIRPIDIDNDGIIEFVVHRRTDDGFILQVLELTTNKEEAMYKLIEPIEKSLLYDGSYLFTISRFSEDEGSQSIGKGIIEIKNGMLSVAKEERILETGAIGLYDSFKGQIDKEGNIVSSLKMDVLWGKKDTKLLNLNGNLKDKIKGNWDKAYDVVIKIKKNESTSLLYDGKYPFTISRFNEDEGSKSIGKGIIEIKNDMISVVKEERILETGSIDLYNTLKGQIDKEGNIISSLKMDVLWGKESSKLVKLNGNIRSELKGKWDKAFYVILKLGKKE